MDSDKNIIEELKKRGFQHDMFIDVGPSFYKNYKDENQKYYYSIIVTLNRGGQVYLANYYIDNMNDDTTICLNYSKELKNDLLYILENLKENKD